MQLRILPLLLALSLHASLPGAEPTPQEIEFFEKSVRPVLVEHCYKCHSVDSKNLKGGLRVDSRQGLLEGGDSGTSLVPGDPAKSKLVIAVTYKDVDLQMPQKGKLPQKAIDDLTKWVAMGAPWPDDKKVVEKKKEFNLEERKRSHWAWSPIEVKPPLLRENLTWAESEIDRYLLASLQGKKLNPAAEAERATLLRRLTFSLIGLPPTPEELDAFLQDDSPHAWDKVVDRLLASPKFGERWGRHWLDLVRYAESRGHEFDPNIPNAWQYRDYIIRAFNDDVPYDQLVREHLAGDLLSRPRLNLSDRFNESILGTGFWYLGEEVHSPVDIRGDQADRFDNRIDVFSKTFLGLTVSCARCHDHKFDAITTKDYYSLYGYLESTNARLVRFDGWWHNQQIAKQLQQLREQTRPKIQKSLADQWQKGVEQMPEYLLTARELILKPSGSWKQLASERKLEPERLNSWIGLLQQAVRNDKDPLHGFALLALAPSEEEGKKRLAAKFSEKKSSPPMIEAGNVIVDYSLRKPEEFLPDDLSFGFAPKQAGELIFGRDEQTPVERFVEFPSAEKELLWNDLKNHPDSQNESSSLGNFLRSGKTIRTPSFELKSPRIYLLVKGRGTLYAAVDQHVMLAGPLHGSLIQHFDTRDQFQWVSYDYSVYKGHRLHLELTSTSERDFAIRQIVQGETPPPLSELIPLLSVWQKSGSAAEVASEIKSKFADALKHLRDDSLTPGSDSRERAMLLNWLLRNPELVKGDTAKFDAEAEKFLEAQGKLVEQIQWQSRLALAMQEGTGVEEKVFIRGSHKALGEVAPRRLPEALVGNQQSVNPGSGRLELAEQMLNPRINPFTSRVIVNRVWHHLTGRGLVGSVDNFGVLGELPTHPELLDYLADDFVRQGWSIKQLIRKIVTSKFYRMSSTPTPGANEIDPENLLLHRMRVHRLEGEAIRDAMLHLSGRLDEKFYGASVPLHLTDFLEGRGRPNVQGPLDGNGRRSIYIAVRRNFLSPMMLAFDTPSPFSTVGKRTVSNVPAQALILLNDPFVHQQAQLWARRILQKADSTTNRIRLMYRMAFSRDPSSEELKRAEEFITKQLKQPTKSEAGVWSDLAHVLINVKEFIFVP